MAFVLIIANPSNTEWSRWAAALAAQCSSTMAVPQDPEEWKSFICSLIDTYPLNLVNCPRPDSYPTWQEWATRLMQTAGAGT